MKVLIQRVKQASVFIDDDVYAEIMQGYLIYLGIGKDDTVTDVSKLVTKLLSLRLFEDENQKTNLNINQVNGEILVVSQFTLYANVQKGNRPSFVDAADPELAFDLYELFISQLKKESGLKIEHGKFGAYMQVTSVNDGLFTIQL